MFRWSLLLLSAASLGIVASPMQSEGDERTAITAVRCENSASRAALPASPALAWRGDAVRSAEWAVSLGEHAIKARVIVVEIDPSRVSLQLAVARDGDAMRPWSLEDADSNAVVAFNAGQFTDRGPWGWVVHNGREHQTPGTGPLTAALVVDDGGALSMLSGVALDSARRTGRVREAVQSYPMLLHHEGAAPSVLCGDDTRIDRTHRDARLAVGITRTGRLIVALTRFDEVGTMAGRLPIGPTTPEMAEIMRRLGAERAMMLDGGLSAQLMTRRGRVYEKWEGMRRVPLAIVGHARTPA